MQKFSALGQFKGAGSDGGFSQTVAKLLSKDELPPKEKHLVALLELLTTPEAADDFFADTVKAKNIKSSHVVVWKALGVTHHVLQHAKPSVFSYICTKHRDSVNYLRRLTTHETSLYAKSAAVLVQAIDAKISFHDKYPEFAGNLTSSETAEALLTKHTDSIFQSILELLQLDIVCASVVFSMSTAALSPMGTAHTSRRRGRKRSQDSLKQSLLLWPMVAVVLEIVSLYELCVKMLGHLSLANMPSLDQHFRLFKAQHLKVYHIFENTRKVPYLASKVYTLNLKRETPSLVHGEPLDVPTRLNPAPVLADERGGKSFSLSPQPTRRAFRSNTTSSAFGAGRTSLQPPTSSSSSSRTLDDTGAHIPTTYDELRHDYEIQRALVASLQDQVKALRSGLTDVDADTVAALHLDGILIGKQDVQRLQREKKELDDLYETALDELDTVRAALHALEQTLESETEASHAHVMALEEVAAEKEGEAEAFKAQVSSLLDVVGDKEKEVAELRAQLEEKSLAIASALSESAELTEKLAAAEHELGAASHTISKATKQTAALEDARSELELEHVAVTEQLVELQAAHSALVAENGILSSRIKQLKEDSARDGELRRSLEAKLDETEQRYEQASQELLAALQGEIDTKQALQATSQELSLAQENVAQLQHEGKAQGERVAELEAELHSAHERWAATKAQADETEANLERLLKENQDRVAAAVAQDENASQEISRLNAESAADRAAIRELKQGNQKTLVAIASLEEKLGNAKGELAVAGERVEALEDELTRETARHREERVSLEGSVSSLQRELSLEKSRAASSIEKLKRGLALAETQAIEAKAQADADAADLNAEISRLKETCRRQKEDFEERIQAMKSRMAAKASAVELELRDLEEAKESALQLQRKFFDSSIEDTLLKRSVTDFDTSVCDMIDAMSRFIMSPTLFGSHVQSSGSDGNADDESSTATSSRPASTSSSSSARVGSDYLSSVIKHKHAIDAKIGTVMLCARLQSYVETAGDSFACAETTAVCSSIAPPLATILKAISNDDAFAAEDARKEFTAVLEKMRRIYNVVELDNEKHATGLNAQMKQAAMSVHDAVSRIGVMLTHAQEQLEEKSLNVHKDILDESMKLMRFIQGLIASSTDLQQEIVALETKTGLKTTAAQFYKRNSRWVDGLISAAKAVGAAATELVDTADRALSGHGKFEEIMVCGQEITASTAQLVSASRVKAKRESAKKVELEAISKQVYSATQSLIEAVRAACQKMSEVKSAQDYLSLSLPQARRLQMDAQVRVKELEYALLKEQERLRQIRKAQYKLAEERATTKRKSISDPLGSS